MSNDEKTVRGLILRQIVVSLAQLNDEKYPERKEMHSCVICNLASAYESIGGENEQETEQI